MALYNLAPYDARQYFDDSGNPLAGGLVYTWVSGTSTPLQTFSDAIGTPNTNPIILSASGRCRMYLLPVAYKITYTDQFGTPVGLTMDPVTASASAVGSGGGLGEVFSFGGDPNSPITSTVYPSGATYDKLHAGTAVFKEDANNLPGTYAIRIVGKMDTSGTLTVAIVNLSDGAPDTPLATATATSLTGEVADSGSITFGAAGVQKYYGIKALISANTGFAWGIKLIRTS